MPRPNVRVAGAFRIGGVLMRRAIAMLACSLMVAVGLVSAAPASEAALPPLPVTITCTGHGCYGQGELGPILILTQSNGAFSYVVACLNNGHGACSQYAGEVFFNHQYIVAFGVAGSAVGDVVLGLHFVEGFLGVPGLLISAQGSRFGTVVALFTPHLVECVVYNGTGIHLTHCS